MKKFLVTLALLSLTTLVLGGCLEQMTEEETPAEEVVVEETTPSVEPEVTPAEEVTTEEAEAPVVEETPSVE